MAGAKEKAGLPATFLAFCSLGMWQVTPQPIDIERVLPGRKRIRGGEARHIASVRAAFLGSHLGRHPPMTI